MHSGLKSYTGLNNRPGYVVTPQWVLEAES